MVAFRSLATGVVDAMIAQRPYFYGYISFRLLYAVNVLG
jgi:hypothetical protein